MFLGQILGPWGSGSEYLRVYLPKNSLPNAKATLFLRYGVTVVDETTYDAIGSSRSWARFKDPMTGVPVDNGAPADFYVSMLPTENGPNDRHRPTFTFAKTVSALTGAPGDTMQYTIYFNNTDTGLAKNVYVNDTLPAGVTFVTSSIAPTSMSGSTYRWVFTDVLPNTVNSITITAVLDAGLTDGSTLANAATLEYTDQLTRPLVGLQAWANLTVSRPVIDVVKTVSPANAGPGDVVTFTIYYNNTGSAPAGTVTIRDVLPSGLSYLSSNPAPTWTDGRTFYWNLTDVAPGNYSIVLTAQIDLLYNGSEIVNWAFLNYTTTNGFALESSSGSAIIAIPELADILFVALVPFLLLVIRRRLRRGEKE